MRREYINKNISPFLLLFWPYKFNNVHFKPLDDPCLTFPCENGGTCQETSSTTYECQCDPGWDPATDCADGMFVCIQEISKFTWILVERWTFFESGLCQPLKHQQPINQSLFLFTV